MERETIIEKTRAVRREKKKVEGQIKKIEQQKKKIAKYVFIGFIFFVLLFAILLKSISWYGDDRETVTSKPEGESGESLPEPEGEDETNFDDILPSNWMTWAIWIAAGFIAYKVLSSIFR